MKNKYTTQLSDEDIVRILENCGFCICENLTDDEGELLPAIERSDDGNIFVRCSTTSFNSHYLDDFFNSLSEHNPKLAQKLFYADTFSSLFGTYNNDVQILLINDFMAYFPFELDEEHTNTTMINETYVIYCAQKFGEAYHNDYANYCNQVLADENDHTM